MCFTLIWCDTLFIENKQRQGEERKSQTCLGYWLNWLKGGKSFFTLSISQSHISIVILFNTFQKTFSCSAGNATFDRLMGHRPVGVTDKGLLQYKYLMSACKSCNQHQKQHKESVKAQSVIKRNKEIKLSIYTSGGITLIDSEFNSNAVDCDNVSFEEEEEVVVTSENEINEEPITILKENKAQSLSLKVNMFCPALSN